jgi:hypothetical protein
MVGKGEGLARVADSALLPANLIEGMKRVFLQQQAIDIQQAFTVVPPGDDAAFPDLVDHCFDGRHLERLPIGHDCRQSAAFLTMATEPASSDQYSCCQFSKTLLGIWPAAP